MGSAGHVVWDWNGTLFDDHHIILDATNSFLEEHGRPPITDEFYAEHFSRDFIRFYGLILDRPVTPEDMEQFGPDWQQRYNTGLPNAALAEGADRAVAFLADQGHTQSILSMWTHDELANLVHEMQIQDWFGHVEGYREGSDRKAEHLVRHVSHVRQAIAPAPDCPAVLIGDTIDDAEAAHAFDIPVVLMATGEHSQKRLRQTGAPVVETIEEAAKLAHELLTQT